MASGQLLGNQTDYFGTDFMFREIQKRNPKLGAENRDEFFLRHQAFADQNTSDFLAGVLFVFFKHRFGVFIADLARGFQDSEETVIQALHSAASPSLTVTRKTSSAVVVP